MYKLPDDIYTGTSLRVRRDMGFWLVDDPVHEDHGSGSVIYDTGEVILNTTSKDIALLCREISARRTYVEDALAMYVLTSVDDEGYTTVEGVFTTHERALSARKRISGPDVPSWKYTIECRYVDEI